MHCVGHPIFNGTFWIFRNLDAKITGEIYGSNNAMGKSHDFLSFE